MKQDISTFITDSFVDFEGKEHKIVACALSQSPENDDHTLTIGWSDSDGYLDFADPIYTPVYRLVTIGIAICNPEDEFDLERGKLIAYNKAAHDDSLPRIYTTSKGIITKELVDVFLKQQVQFFVENPGKFIKGYDKAEKEYRERQSIQDSVNELNQQEHDIFKLALSGFDFSKCLDLAKRYTKKVLKNG